MRLNHLHSTFFSRYLRCLLVVVVGTMLTASNVYAEKLRDDDTTAEFEKIKKDKKSNKDKKSKKDKAIAKIKANKTKSKWEKRRFEKGKMPISIPVETINIPQPPPGEKIELDNTPVPPGDLSSNLEQIRESGLALAQDFLAWLLLPKAAHAADISIDGDLSDWTLDDRINLPIDRPPYLATGDELYGRYVASPTPMYVIALKSTAAAIGNNTTFWLNTDQNASTGYQIWGGYGGAEYFVNVYTDSTPHLYGSDFQWITSLTHAYNADHTVLEVAIPVSALSPLAQQQPINVLGDINDTTLLFPQDWGSGGQYTIAGTPPVYPQRTATSKRVGVVFCDASKDNFFDSKAYSQLFMSLQHQSMMAGITYSAISQNDLTDIAKLVNYDALVFSYCGNISASQLKQIHDTLFKAVYHYGIGIIAADNWLTNDENGNPVPGDSYRYMKQLLGLGRENGDGPVDISVTAADVSHPMMRHYVANEPLIKYTGSWYSYYSGVPGQSVASLASQTVTGNLAGTYPAVLASETGGRNVHFANIGLLGDANLVWQAIQWAIYGDSKPVALNMGRQDTLFVTRIDMDQSQEHDEVPLVEVPLQNILQDWKDRYGYVASAYINIGNDPGNGQYTDWQVSAPLYQGYVDMGQEIGTHSYTHPEDTNLLTDQQIRFEFDTSINEILSQVGPTWRDQTIKGGAVPGAPESLATAEKISQWLDYLTGGYSSFGAGYPGAHGRLTPGADKFYFSPDMSFDFTLLIFGVPTGNPPVPVVLTPEQGTQYWADEYAALTNHANQPVVVWPWHDYCPTAWEPACQYDMFENTINMVYDDDAEFLTAADMNERLQAFEKASLDVSQDGSVITAGVSPSGGNDLSRFAVTVGVDEAAGEVISSVDDWYAYNDTRVFTDADGGVYTIRLGTSVAAKTHISRLPMRAKLTSVTGDGNNLSFTFEGEGVVEVSLSNKQKKFNITGADSYTKVGKTGVAMSFTGYGVHQGSIALK